MVIEPAPSAQSTIERFLPVFFKGIDMRPVFKGEGWQRLEGVLEVLGLAVLLTMAQIALFHIFFADFIVSKYIILYQEYLKKIDILYRLYIAILTKVFGNSYTVSLYNFVAKFFIPVFIVNVGYFTLRRLRK
jgi:hypothetical protein